MNRVQFLESMSGNSRDERYPVVVSCLVVTLVRLPMTKLIAYLNQCPQHRFEKMRSNRVEF